MRSTRAGTGVLVAGMLTAAQLAVLYFGWRVLGLPFPPFEIFDWMTRVLPGSVISFGIENMVAVIRFLGVGPIASTAKLAEQTMGVAGLFVTELIAGTILFVLIRRRLGRSALGLGVLFGLLLGVPITLIGSRQGQSGSSAAALGVGWVLLVFVLWGWSLGWASRRLVGRTLPAGATAEEDAVRRLDRRRFLVRLGGSTALITVAGAVVGELADARRREMLRSLGANGRWSASHALPNAQAAVKPVPGTRPEYTPLDRHYRIDINSAPPELDAQRWRLNISGLVEKPLSVTLEELQRYPALDQFVTLSCISNPVGGDLIGTTRWTGVSLQRLLADWKLKPTATHLKIRSADDFFEVVPLETIRSDERVMLAYAWDGVPLTTDHGFPLRIYIPDVHGMKQPKWIESIELTDHWEPGYWVKRGWDKEARMKATSVIDAVAVDMKIVEADQRTVVPIGGIAHAGARGISKVEVKVDDGPWQPAAVRTPLSSLTWVLWRYEWLFQPGKHTFTVRCFDGTGAPQLVEQHGPKPSGASGLYSKTEML